MLSYVPALSDAFYGFDYEFVSLMPLATTVNLVLVPCLLVRYWLDARDGGLVV